AFLVAAALLAQFTGWRFILFPPLIVIGFEMFAHSAVCPWTGRPLVLTVACALSALAGVELVLTVGNTPLAVAISALVSIFVLRLFDLYAPPILAVGLLSFLIPHANYTFPIAIGIGTLLLVVFFLAWNQFHKRTETRNA
ncbi:MAG: HPP family protein, partial [Burkholderiaceae bacterium]|nr:HPP family protein [Burkholderiaceae bacterium]